jgi:hypothetical protein
MSDPKTAEASHEGTPVPHTEGMIDPELADLPAPSRHASASAQPEDAANNDHSNGIQAAPVSTLYSFDTDHIPLGITESIAQAPNPRPSDFNYNQLADVPLSQENRLDFDTIMNNDTPGSPTTKIMKAVVPHNAAQAEPKWPPVSHSFNYIFPGYTHLPRKIRLDARRGWWWWQCHLGDCLRLPRMWFLVK